jgi:hypothetical protein
MRIVNRGIQLFVFLGLIGIQFTSLLDDPQHLIEPDPHCPLCLAAKTEVCTTPHISISFTPEIILYLIKEVPGDPGIEDCFLSIPIRAPPIS